ncbi:hypothetical protein QR680_010615 [Steinernema hermaphroditum]|uniref:CUB domain-containing protein n=1 Tax=Steinernema hermaphroditum TaxID=289476 RepID=A0AA39IS82_9BILA|nr:hypothetical protein QR680_010615 [Steinernema hermaphroditum]
MIFLLFYALSISLCLAAGAACPPSLTGTTIGPNLPFMLFGSDNVSEITLKEATCVFLSVKSKSGLDLSKVTLTVLDLNGQCTSVGVSALSDVKKYCFPQTATKVFFDMGGLFDGMHPTTPAWRTVIFLFVAKASLTGPCENGNIVDLNDSESKHTWASSSCPAFLLAPSACSKISFFGHSGVPEQTEVSVFTVQNGVRALDDTFLFSFTSETDPKFLHEEDFLRNAIMITSNSTEWQKVIQSTFGPDYGFDENGLLCTLEQEVYGDLKNQVVSSNPYGVEEFKYKVLIGSSLLNLTQPVFHFAIDKYDDKCINLTVVISFINGTKTLNTNPHDSLTLKGAIRYFNIEFSRTNEPGCTYANVKMVWNATLPCMEGPGAEIEADLPFMMWASDNISSITFKEPFCVTTANYFYHYPDISKILLSAPGDGACEVESAYCMECSDGNFLNTYCFHDSATQLYIDNFDVFDEYKDDVAALRTTIFLFTSKKEYRACKGANIILPSLGGVAIMTNSTCPVYVLKPDNIDKDADGGAGRCNNIQIKSEGLPPNLQVDLATVQHPLFHLENTHIGTYTSKNFPAVPPDLPRSALMITANAPSTTSLFKIELDDYLEMGVCSIAPYVSTEVFNAIIDIDPYGTEDFIAEIEINIGPNVASFAIDPYDESCLNVTFTPEYPDGWKMTFFRTATANPGANHQIVDAIRIAVGFYRIEAADCYPSYARIYYNVTTKCEAKKGVDLVAPDLPFMLFGSDNVSTITIKEPFCISVASAYERLDYTFSYATALDCQIIQATSIQKNESSTFCFPDTVSYLYVDRGGMYNVLDSSSPDWRSIVFLFTSKKYHKDCRYIANVFVAGQPGATAEINGNGECPSFILNPTKPAATSGRMCSATGVVYPWDARDTTELKLTTVQNPLWPLNDVHVASYSKQSPTLELAAFSRNALMFSTNITGNKFEMSTLDFNSVGQSLRDDYCEIVGTQSGNIIGGVMDLNPYGAGRTLYTITAFNYPFRPAFQFTFDIAPYNSSCVCIHFAYVNAEMKETEFDATSTSVKLDDAIKVQVSLNPSVIPGCYPYYARITYNSIIVTDENNVNPTTDRDTNQVPTTQFQLSALRVNRCRPQQKAHMEQRSALQ